MKFVMLAAIVEAESLRVTHRGTKYLSCDDANVKPEWKVRKCPWKLEGKLLGAHYLAAESVVVTTTSDVVLIVASTVFLCWQAFPCWNAEPRNTDAYNYYFPPQWSEYLCSKESKCRSIDISGEFRNPLTHGVVQCCKLSTVCMCDMWHRTCDMCDMSERVLLSNGREFMCKQLHLLCRKKQRRVRKSEPSKNRRRN